MARSTLLSLLALAARGASAVDVAAIPHPQALALVVAAATTTDPGLMACATAEALADYCYSAGWLDATVPLQTEAACLCCYQGSYVANDFYSCASYIAASARTATAAYTSMCSPPLTP